MKICVYVCVCVCESLLLGFYGRFKIFWLPIPIIAFIPNLRIFLNKMLQASNWVEFYIQHVSNITGGMHQTLPGEF